ncbi:hypothetical protein ACHAXS_003065, partial [Conticribra weissflogii]
MSVSIAADMGISPRENDVILGRGGLSNNNPGNIHFRRVVAALKGEYAKLTKNKDKRSFAVKIYEEIRGLDPPGRFLQKSKDGDWTLASREKAVDKVQHCLREKRNEEKKLESSQSSADTARRNSLPSQTQPQPHSQLVSQSQEQSQISIGRNCQAEDENAKEEFQNPSLLENKCGCRGCDEGKELGELGQLGHSEELDQLSNLGELGQLDELGYLDSDLALSFAFESENEADFVSVSNSTSFASGSGSGSESESGSEPASECEGLSLVDWIAQNYAKKSWRQTGVSGSSKYIDTSLKIAMKLTDCL